MNDDRGKVQDHGTVVDLEWADDGDAENGPHPYVTAASCPTTEDDSCSDSWFEVKDES